MYICRCGVCGTVRLWRKMINRRYGNGGPEIEEGEGEGRSLPQTACIPINLCACACLFLEKEILT